MKVVDVQWTPHLNLLTILCDCGLYWTMWANTSVVSCPNCGLIECYHGVDPKHETGPWSYPQMEIELDVYCLYPVTKSNL